MLRNVLTPQRLEVLCLSRPLKNALRQRYFFEMAHLALIFFSFVFEFKLEVTSFFQHHSSIVSTLICNPIPLT